MPKNTKGGIIIYTKINNEYFVPLFLNNRFKTYVSLGGTFENTDETVKKTAIRESFEESYGLVDFEELLNDNENYDEHTFEFKYSEKKIVNYTIYFVFIGFDLYEILKSSYNKNRSFYKTQSPEFIKNNKHFYEMSNMRLFSLSKFKENNSSDLTIILNRKSYTIWDITCQKLNFLYNKLIKKKYINPILCKDFENSLNPSEELKLYKKSDEESDSTKTDLLKNALKLNKNSYEKVDSSRTSLLINALKLNKNKIIIPNVEKANIIKTALNVNISSSSNISFDKNNKNIIENELDVNINSKSDIKKTNSIKNNLDVNIKSKSTNKNNDININININIKSEFKCTKIKYWEIICYKNKDLVCFL